MSNVIWKLLNLYFKIKANVLHNTKTETAESDMGDQE